MSSIQKSFFHLKLLNLQQKCPQLTYINFLGTVPKHEPSAPKQMTVNLTISYASAKIPKVWYQTSSLIRDKNAIQS